MARPEKKVTYTRVKVKGKPRINIFPPYGLVQPGEEMVCDTDQADFFEAMGMADIVEYDVPNPNDPVKPAASAKAEAKTEAKV